MFIRQHVRYSLFSALQIVLFCIIFQKLYGQTNFSIIGPGGGGYFSAVVFHPANSDIIYAGTDLGGVFKSIDGGSFFFPVNTGLQDYIVQEIAFDALDPNIMYLATTGGVYKSIDSGNSWQLKRNGFPGKNEYSFSAPVNCLGAGNKYQPGTLYAGFGRGLGNSKEDTNYGKGIIFRSEDGGENWAVGNTGTPNIDAQATIFEIRVHPYHSYMVFATTDKGFYKSSDYGVSWRKINNGLPGDDVRGLAFRPFTTDYRTLYVTVISPAGVVPWRGGVYRSDDYGETFTAKTNGLKAVVDTTSSSKFKTTNFPDIVIKENNPNVLFIGDWKYGLSGVWRSIDSGASWTELVQQESDLSPMYLDMFAAHNLAISKSDPGKLLFGNFYHLVKSENSGNYWFCIDTAPTNNEWQNSGLDNTKVGDMEFSPTDANTMYFAYWDIGIFKTVNHGATFRATLPGVDILDIELDPAQENILYACSDKACSENNQYKIFYSQDYGESWSIVWEGIGKRIYCLLIDPESPLFERTIYIGVQGEGVYKKIGSDWVLAGLAGKTPVKLVRHPNFSQTIYALTAYYGLYQTSDGGLTWQRLGENFFDRPQDMVINPLNPLIINIAVLANGSKQGGDIYFL
ncbi:MAG: hypothetical protein A2096_04510 [Spirochaetes bacterium GWF1_41_5]|nr:MAG: hypothetical protein A2096_04510 [Spirochaetes bacterium GWF1_41_5]HBE03572.1 hypothetical protein [Spirochaetia bacterium]